MDLLTASLTFAQIVGLLSNYSSENSGGKAANFEDFMTWLTEKNHGEVVTLLESNQQTAISIKALLNEGMDGLNIQLAAINETLFQISSGFAGFKDVAKALNPDAPLSEQAISIIEQFVSSGARRILVIKTYESESLVIVEGGHGEITFTDRQFVFDDLNTLEKLGFLTRSDKNNAKGYEITRAAAAFVKNRKASNGG